MRKMKIIVIAHKEKEEAKKAAKAIKKWIKANGHEVVAKNKLADLAIGLGGDGTVIHNIGYFSKKGIPFIVINAGDVGFLTTGNISDWEPILKKLIAKQYVIEKRVGLELAYNGKKYGPYVNDIFLRHTKSTVNFKIILNGNVLHKDFSAIGYNVSTSTGSTGYNISLGGPIAEPGVSCLLLNPISPISINTRPIISNPGSEIIIEAVRKKPGEVIVVGNGKELGTLEVGEKVTIRKHKTELIFAVLNHYDFYIAMQEKKGLMK